MYVLVSKEELHMMERCLRNRSAFDAPGTALCHMFSWSPLAWVDQHPATRAATPPTVERDETMAS